VSEDDPDRALKSSTPSIVTAPLARISSALEPTIVALPTLTDVHSSTRTSGSVPGCVITCEFRGCVLVSMVPSRTHAPDAPVLCGSVTAACAEAAPSSDAATAAALEKRIPACRPCRMLRSLSVRERD
jgi:hypothetical protein